MRGLILLLLVVLFPTTSQGALVLTFGSGNVFMQNSGVHTIDVFVRTNNATPEGSFGMSTDFTLSGGAFAPNDHGFAFSAAVPAPGETKTGFIGLPGSFGVPNIDAGITFFSFLSADPSSAVLSIAVNPQFSVPTTDILLARLTVNVNGLAVNNYSITAASNAGGTGASAVVGASGSFTITAVPEPSSILGVSLLAIGGCFYGWQRHQKKRSAVSV